MIFNPSTYSVIYKTTQDLGDQLDPELAAYYLQMASNGNTSGQSKLCDEMVLRDADIASVWGIRNSAISSLEWTITGDDETLNNTIKEKLANISGNWDANYSDMAQLISYLNLAVLHGFSTTQIVWDDSGTGIEGFNLIPHSHFNVDLTKNLPYLTIEKKDGKPKTVFPEKGDWVLHRYNTRTNNICRSGLVRPLIYIQSYKKLVQGDYLRYLEKFGMPLVKATVEADFAEIDSLKRAKLVQFLENWSSDGYLVDTKDLTLDMIQPSQQSGNQFQDCLKHFQSQVARLLIGQESSMFADAANKSSAQVMDAIRKGLMDSDIKAIEQTINRDIIKPLVDRNVSGVKNYPKFSFDLSNATDIRDVATSLQMIAQSGVQLKPEIIAKLMRIDKNSFTLKEMTNGN